MSVEGLESIQLSSGFSEIAISTVLKSCIATAVVVSVVVSAVVLVVVCKLEYVLLLGTTRVWK